MHTGLSQKAYQDRVTIVDAMSVIEDRWPGAHPILLTELRTLVEQIADED